MVNSLEKQYTFLKDLKFCKNPIELYPISFLQSRYEHKYIVTSKQFEKIFNKNQIRENYSIGFNNNLSFYENQYYDLNNNFLYRIHHNGKKNRFKIRTRKYQNQLKYNFEINYKTNKNFLIKNRFHFFENEDPIKKFSDKISIITNYRPNLLYKTLKTKYHRITMFNQFLNERVTIDTGINFFGNKNISFNGIFIIELKSGSFSNRSPLVNLLKDLKIESVSFSKYCIGMALTEKKIKKNNFKAMLLKLNKIMEN